MVFTDEEYMEMAHIAQRHADCKWSQVGAVLVLPNGGLIPGVNHSMVGQVKCVDGGCYRCVNRAAFGHGKGYDLCTCVHAEEACLTFASRHGIRVEGATVYSTLQPCRQCVKQMTEAGVYRVFYEKELPVGDNEGEVAAYQRLLDGFAGGFHQISGTPVVASFVDEIRVEVPLNLD